MSKRKSGIWLIVSALGALLPPGSVVAADLPVKAKPIVAAAFDWSGVYIGAHAGYGGGMKDWTTTGVIQADFIARGALVGGQIGINKQFGSFVFGLELDGSWADIKGSSQITIGSAGFGSLFNIANSSGIDGLATIAGRAGLAADRWFVFAKAGISAAHENHSVSFVQALGAPGTSIVARGTETRYAPMLGFGTEYALFDNWSLFGEYNFHHFGERSVRLEGTVAQGALTIPFAIDQRIDQSIHAVKIGVNYRFGGVGAAPSYAAVPPAPGTNWTGGYIGVQGGYGWGHTQWPDGFVPAGIPYPNAKTDGWLAGGTVGANAQAGSLMFGVEGEILGTGLRGSQTTTAAAINVGVETTTVDSKVNWLALATARAGFVVGSNLMLYGKGGVAIVEQSHSVSLTQTAPPASGVFTGKAVHTGVVVGAGGEYAFAPNWSVKAEYDYVRMFQQALLLGGSFSGGLFGGAAFVVPANKMNQDLHLVKFGVNYHFNPLPVVVAKY